MDEELESFLTAHQEYGHFNNTVLVFQSDESIFARGYGEAVREHGIPNAVEIKYNVASYTKQFCAETVLRLVQDGRLSSEQTIDKWYPEQTSASKITIYHLLTIPSGIPNVTVVAGSDKVEHWRDT